jgi:hypothetical protein
VTGVPLATGPVVELDPQNNDTDGDGLEDGEEVNMDERVTHEPPDEQELETGFAWSSNPAAGNVDTDGDGLTDSDEVGGWNISVVTSNGGPYMWALASEEPADDTLHVTSDPQKVDTDGDRLDDPQEIRKTHTDPSAVQTYGITADHESDFRNAFQGQKSAQEWRMKKEMGLRSDQRPFVDNIEDPDLTDGTDSFDFVTAELELGLDQFNFTGLDGTTRTDYWIPNVDEVITVDPSVPVNVAEGGRYELDPWDPDGDDDGLTDGEEITGVRVRDGGSTDVFFTDPTEADSDGMDTGMAGSACIAWAIPTMSSCIETTW